MFESVLPTVLVPCVVELLFVVPELVLPLLLVLLVLELLELFELFELFDELEPLLPFTSRLVVLLSDDHLLINYQRLEPLTESGFLKSPSSLEVISDITSSYKYCGYSCSE